MHQRNPQPVAEHLSQAAMEHYTVTPPPAVNYASPDPLATTFTIYVETYADSLPFLWLYCLLQFEIVVFH